MTIPDYQSLMLHVLVAAFDGEIRVGAAVERLAEKLGLSSEERDELLPSGRQTVFANRVHWAKTYLAQAGLVESTRRGYFRITERGRQVLASNPPRVDNEFLNRFEKFREFRKRGRQAISDLPVRRSPNSQTRRTKSVRRTRSCDVHIRRLTPPSLRNCSVGCVLRLLSFF